MKRILANLLILLPIIGQAQISTVTENQKQEALQHVRNFCSLLLQWSNGQRNLDTQIYALCSGNDCSAYDDVSTNKETTLRNYLLGIQKKYPKSLNMEISQPSLSNCKIVYEPQMLILNTDAIAQGGQLNAQIQSYKNSYFVFSVNQTSLSRTDVKKIVYDVNAKKITAFIKGNGTYISFLDGITLITQKDYRTAINKFLYAAENNRSSLQKKCYQFVGYIYSIIGDYPNSIKYYNLTGSSLQSDMVKAVEANSVGDTQALIELCLQIEQKIKSTGEMTEQLPYVYLMLGIGYTLHNSRKSISYFELAAKGGLPEAGYTIYQLTMISNLHGEGDFNEIVGDNAFHWLRWSAENGYSPAFYDLGHYEDVIKNNGTEAMKWFKYSASAGNPMGMACYGKKLIEAGNKEEGKKWMRKALEGNTLDIYLKNYDEGIGLIYWPKSRSDIQTLLNKVSSSTTNSSSSTHTYSSSTNSNTSYQSNTIYTNSSSSNYRYKSHRPFNHKVDDYWGGFSIGYIQKQWTDEYERNKEKFGVFNDEKYLKGIQAGFRIDPQIGGGFGINTGIFYEYCWTKTDDQFDEYGSYHLTYEEHGLYSPVHLKFTMNFSKWFQLSFYGGTGFNYVLSGKAYVRDDGETYGSENFFKEEEDWKKFNIMIEYGAALRINALQFDFSVSKGITKWFEDNDNKTTQGRPINLSMTICF